MTQRRVLFLMSDTGGGHRSAAEAICAALAREFPDHYDATLVDVFKRAAKFPLNHAPDLYLPLTQRAEFLWGTGFQLLNHRGTDRLAQISLRLNLMRGVQRILREPIPDLVVSVHPVFNELPRRVLRAYAPRVPFVTVVTDLFDAHRMWFDPGVDLCIVPTDGARRVAQRCGMPADKVRVIGQPISLKFLGDQRTQAEHRAELGLAERTTILLVGGGEGMGKLLDIARALDRARLPIQLVIIAGRNKALADQLRALTWHLPAHIQGFVTNMPDWMRAADLIITKAGPGTIMEALACGLPILLSGFLPGQENGNVTFVEQGGVGALRKNPDDIARLVGEWLTPGNDTLARFAARARELARPHAALDIAHALHQVLDDA